MKTEITFLLFPPSETVGVLRNLPSKLNMKLTKSKQTTSISKQTQMLSHQTSTKTRLMNA